MSETIFERRAGAQEHYQRGLQLKRKGFLLEAEQEFRQSMEVDPSYFDPLLELLVEQEESGISEDIRTDQLLRRADQKYKLGMALLKHDHPKKAVRHLSDACNLERDNARYHCGLAQALAASGRKEEAKEKLRVAAELNGGSNPRQHRAKAHYLMGKMHFKDGHTQRAKRRLLMAYSLNPESEETLALLKKMGVGALRRRFMLPRLQHKTHQRRESLKAISRDVGEEEGVLADLES